jgi:hypothetical protein
MDQTLIYVSRKLLAPATERAEIASIMEISRERNAALAVTGALLVTIGNFAQVLEGPPDAIEALMARIRRDPRHRDVQVVRTAPIQRRRFPTWSLAYAGDASYIARHIEPLMDADPDTNAHRIDELIDLMYLLTTR